MNNIELEIKLAALQGWVHALKYEFSQLPEAAQSIGRKAWITGVVNDVGEELSDWQKEIKNENKAT